MPLLLFIFGFFIMQHGVIQISPLPCFFGGKNEEICDCCFSLSDDWHWICVFSRGADGRRRSVFN